MDSSIQPLTKEEKKLICRVFKLRLVLFFVFLLPVLLGIIFVLYHALNALFNNEFDLVTIAALLFFPTILLLMGRYFVPLYRDSYRNLRATEKQVVETTVLHERHWWTRRGYHYLIETEFKSFDSWENTILMPGLGFGDLKMGDHITIQLIRNNKLDVLRIEKANFKIKETTCKIK